MGKMIFQRDKDLVKVIPTMPAESRELGRGFPWSKLMSPSQRSSGQGTHIVVRQGNLSRSMGHG